MLYFVWSKETCRKIPSQIQLSFYEVMSSQLDLPDCVNAIKGKHLFMIHSDSAQRKELGAWIPRAIVPLQTWSRGFLVFFSLIILLWNTVFCETSYQQQTSLVVQGTDQQRECRKTVYWEFKRNGNTVQPCLWEYDQIKHSKGLL